MTWNQKEFIDQCNKSPLFYKKNFKVTKNLLVKHKFKKAAYLGTQDLLDLYYLIFPKKRPISEELLRELKKEFKKWLGKEGFIPSGDIVNYSVRQIQQNEVLYKLIGKTNPLAQELLEDKNFRQDFQKFRKKNKIDTLVTYQNVKKWNLGCGKKLENEIALFLDKMLNKYSRSESWKGSFRNYLFVFSLTPPLSNTIYLEYEPKKKVSISFTSKNVSKKELINFIEFQWPNVKELKNKHLKDEGHFSWKENLENLRFAYWLKEKKGFSLDKIYKIMRLLQKINEIKKDSLGRQIRKHKRRYLR